MISFPGNLTRVSTSLRTFALLSQLQENAARVFRQEAEISSGRKILSVSDDPIAAEQIARLNKSLQSQDQILTNLRHADAHLSATDSAIADMGDLLTEAARIASEQASSTQSAEERSSQAIVIDSLIDQLMNIGNREYQGYQLFGGRSVRQAPLDTSLGRVTNIGDQGARETLVSTISTLPFNLTASDLFRLRDSVTGGYANFDVQLNASGRINELKGAIGAGVRLGQITVTEVGPNTTFQVDFSGADSLNDIIAKFNDAAATAGSTLTMGINPADGTTLQITSGGGNGIQIDNVGQSTTATDLGIEKTVAAGATLDGDGLQRQMTLTTPLSDLIPGGLSLPDGVKIQNGDLTATVVFTGATTVQDVLNSLNGAHVGIRASINAAGNGIEIENLIAGTDLVIGENGGNDAEALGIRTVDASVSVSRLNGGRGIHPVTGSDLRITDDNGVVFEVDLDNARTLGDVIAAINAASTAAGASIVASTSPNGGGLRLTGSGGAGSITVEKANLSPVAEELGILKTGSSTVLDGDIVGAFRQTGIFSHLYRLRDALLADDSSEITEAGSQINEMQRHAADIAGEVGSRSRGMQARLQQTDDAVTATTLLLSDVQDVDFAEAVAKFQQAQTALQASLLTSSKLSNLTLLDFLQ